jgi:cellulose synthase/poly-beta-1,6-N-acetylglucosamine synthase-like glycosyltransferase
MAFQAKSGSPREKWIAALLPTVGIILITFIYTSFFLMPTMQSVDEEYKRSMASAISADVIMKLQVNVAQLREEKEELDNTINSVSDEASAKSVAFEELSPTAKHGAVTALFREYDAAIINDQVVADVSLSKLRSNSIDTLETMVSKKAINFRKLTLTADYVTVVELLEKLPEIEGVIPISIMLDKKKGIDPSDESGLLSPVWTVTLLM